MITQNIDEPHKVIVTVCGTVVTSVYSWIFQDIDVRLKPWPFPRGPEAGDLKTTTGVLRTLSTICDLKDGKLSCLEKLQELSSAADRPLSVTFTGHSLGGTVIPCLALLFSDSLRKDRLSSAPITKTSSTSTSATFGDPEVKCGVKSKNKQENDDKIAQTTISVITFAGFTPGNQDFSDYYNRRLGCTTTCFRNLYDIVPHLWNIESFNLFREAYEAAGVKHFAFSIITRYLKFLGVYLLLLFYVIQFHLFTYKRII